MAIELLTERPSRVLCVVAHPDDLEYGTSAAVAHWTAQGTQVAYLLLTRGEAGMQRPPEETIPVRAEEQLRACATVGVTDLTMLDHRDGVLEFTLDLRRDVARAIRRFQPDTVITTTWEYEPSWGGLNQADHRVAGLTVVDAIPAADNRWIFRELIEEGLMPHKVSQLLVNGMESNVAVQVSEDEVMAGVRSLECHEAYLADLPNHPKPAEFIPETLRHEGEQAGVEFAVAFRRFPIG